MMLQFTVVLGSDTSKAGLYHLLSAAGVEFEFFLTKNLS